MFNSMSTKSNIVSIFNRQIYVHKNVSFYLKKIFWLDFSDYRSMNTCSENLTMIADKL